MAEQELQLKHLQNELNELKAWQTKEAKGNNKKEVNNMEVKEHIAIRVALPLSLVRELESNYEGRCLIGLMFGPCWPMEVLKRWTQ